MHSCIRTPDTFANTRERTRARARGATRFVSAGKKRERESEREYRRWGKSTERRISNLSFLPHRSEGSLSPLSPAAKRRRARAAESLNFARRLRDKRRASATCVRVSCEFYFRRQTRRLRRAPARVNLHSQHVRM